MKEINSKKETQRQIEERIKYFMKFQENKTIKQKNLDRIPNFNDYSTLIDPINIQNKGSNAIFINNLTLIMNNNQTGKVKNNIPNGINNVIKEKPNESTISSQTINNLEIPIKKSVSIPISKELVKYTEPSLKKKQLLKIMPKFTIDIKSDKEKANSKNNRINHNHKYSQHNYTNSEFEILKTEEEVPQNEIEEIANNILIYNSQNNKKKNYMINNEEVKKKKDENINKKTILSIFHFLINIEKCYRELSDDLKNNGIKNLEYKLKIACLYINIIKDEKNLISDIFLKDEEDINSFLNRELCLYITILFLDKFAQSLNDNHIREFLTCLNYCNINLLHIWLC